MSDSSSRLCQAGLQGRGHSQSHSLLDETAERKRDVSETIPGGGEAQGVLSHARSFYSA